MFSRFSFLLLAEFPRDAYLSIILSPARLAIHYYTEHSSLVLFQWHGHSQLLLLALGFPCLLGPLSWLFTFWYFRATETAKKDHKSPRAGFGFGVLVKRQQHTILLLMLDGLDHRVLFLPSLQMYQLIGIQKLKKFVVTFS
jgi:hypothetical protein